jgi:hypothetical protein
MAVLLLSTDPFSMSTLQVPQVPAPPQEAFICTPASMAVASRLALSGTAVVTLSGLKVTLILFTVDFLVISVIRRVAPGG